MKALMIVVLTAVALFSCNQPEDLNAKIPSETNMRVNAQTVSCTGEMEGTCLLVQEGDQLGSEDWSYFYYYNSIEGFEYEPGFIYNLKVTKTEVLNPAQDAPSVTYRLEQVLSKEKI